MLDKLKIAIVCDWLTVYAGAERVIYEMHQLFPDAPIYTTIYNKKRCKLFSKAELRESNLGLLPGARRFHQLFFPFMPKVFERMDLSEFDLVISSSHSAAKGIITKPETLHVSYCHSPMRYLWDQSHSYQNAYYFLKPFKFIYRPILHRTRMWDKVASARVDRFIANSYYVGRRISKYYGRESDVIFPPVDLSYFSQVKSKRVAYLAIGRLIPYKRFDLIVEAFNKLKLPLRIVGTGGEMARLKSMAKANIEFLGKVSDEELREVYQSSKALIFPQLEDFGIVPLEAMSCGTPVVAYGKGGALETVKEGVSGIFFEEQSAKAIVKAVKLFERSRWSPKRVSESVKSFSSARFKSEFRHYLESAWKEHREMLV